MQKVAINPKNSCFDYLLNQKILSLLVITIWSFRLIVADLVVDNFNILTNQMPQFSKRLDKKIMSGDANINTTANLWDLEVRSQGGSHTLTMQTDLIVSNDLTINNNTTLDTDAANDFNLNIGADFTIVAGGTYTANSNTTAIDGTKTSNLNFGGLLTLNDFTVIKDVAAINLGVIASD